MIELFALLLGDFAALREISSSRCLHSHQQLAAEWHTILRSASARTDLLAFDSQPTALFVAEQDALFADMFLENLVLCAEIFDHRLCRVA